MKASYSLLTLAVVLLAVGYWGVIFTLTHITNPPNFQIRHIDKFQHAGAYALLALLLCGVVWRFSHSLNITRWTVLGIVALYGAFDELTQLFVPNRTADPTDWLADMCGSVVGIFLFGVALSFWKRVKK